MTIPELFWILLALVSANESVVSSTPNTYFVLKENKTNHDALERCKELGYDGLALVNSPTALSEALSIINKGEDEYWIGMHYSDRVSSHFWDSGFVVQWAEWTPGEPDNLPRDKCVRIRTSKQFGTYDCQKDFFAICGNHKSRSITIKFKWQDLATQDFSSTIWSGKTRSLVDCVSICLGNKGCEYVAFDQSQLYCTILSSSFDAETSTKPSPGAVVGMKISTF